MRPSSIVLGIILGSASSVAVGLAFVLVVFALRQGEDPRFTAEVPELLRAFALFGGLAASAALAFVGSLWRRPWRIAAYALLVAGVLGVVAHYLPG